MSHSQPLTPSHTVGGSHSHTTSDNEWKGVALQLVALNCYGIITQ